MLLAGDIGGTKTNLAIYAAEGGPRKPLVEATFPSDDYPDLETIARAFLAHTDYKVRYACFGVAGPIVNGHVKTTNLPWEMDETHLRDTLGLDEVHLLNDLESIGTAVPRLEAEDLYMLNEGRPEPHGAIGVIAPGTGLGEGYVVWDGSRYCAQPSEGGHTDFGPSNEREIELLRYWLSRKGHVSYETVCSGIGIGNIYTFLKDTGHAPEPDWLAERFASAEDTTPIIVQTALEKNEPLCSATLETFISILGAEAGNVALKVLATGGIYLGGGIPPRILPALQQGQFMHAFLRKGRFANLLGRMPVKVILNPKAALMGAATYGLEMEQADA
ncbi:MAG: glucokinase [Anaerolineae bacterium]|nr:glucokinase [Anaerolineae bacterium]